MILINDDCLKAFKQIPTGSIDFICTDIPYELNKHGGTKSALAKRNAKVRDSVEFMAHGIDYDNIFNEFIRVCKIPNMVIFCSNLQIGKIINWFNDKKLKTDLLVWKKSNPAPLCNGKYVSDLEYMIYVHTKGTFFNNEAEYKYKLKGKIYPIMTSKNKLHPTQKPLGLMQELIEVHSSIGNLILDPFMGSGTTGEACGNLNRDFIGIELDKNYFDIAVKRLEKFKPEVATL